MNDDAILEVIAAKLKVAREEELMDDARQLQILFRDFSNMDGPRPCLYENGKRKDGKRDEFKVHDWIDFVHRKKMHLPYGSEINRKAENNL